MTVNLSDQARQQNVQTTLDPVVSGLPWADGFRIGASVNAVTGVIGGNAIKPPQLKEPVHKQSQYRYKFVKSKRDMEQEIEVSASGKYNINGISIEGSTSYLNKIHYSELSISLIAEYNSGFQDYKEANTYELTEEAHELIKDREKFRSIFGDYFVSGSRIGSRFLVVYVCKASSYEEMNKFTMSFGVNAPNVFSASGSAKFERSVSENNISLEVSAFYEGYNGTAPVVTEPDQVIPALEWFQEHETGLNQKAKLMHFSTLYPAFSPQIDIAPGVFVELRKVYANRWLAESLYESIPEYYQRQFRDEFNNVNNSIQAYASVLAQNPEKREELTKASDNLIGKLSDIQDRQAFYYKVLDLVKSEPEKNKHFDEKSDGPQHWVYGFTSYNQSPAVVIHSYAVSYHESWHVGHRESNLGIPHNQNNLLVGWEVISNWTDGSNGSWWKVSDQILLEHAGTVHVKSEYDRGTNWTARFYYVDSNQFVFGDQLAFMEKSETPELVAETNGEVKL